MEVSSYLDAAITLVSGGKVKRMFRIRGYMSPRPWMLQARETPLNLVRMDPTPQSSTLRLLTEWTEGATIQSVGPRLPTAAARVRTRVRLCETCGRQSGIGAGFLWVLPFRCQSFHRVLHTLHHPTSGAGIIGLIVADVPSGLSLIIPYRKELS
jgi:hypothetical protein